MNIPLYLFVIALFVICSSFFSGTEIAYTSVREQRLYDSYEKKKTTPRRYAVYFLSHYDDMLATILIGNNLVNQASSAMATVVVIGLLGENYSWLATLIMTVIILTFGEVLPKSICKARSELICVASSVPLKVLSIVFYPAVALVNRIMEVMSRLWAGIMQTDETISEGELSSVMDIVKNEGVLDEEHTTLVKRAIYYKDIRAYEIITPRVDLEYIDINDSAENIILRVLSSGHSRLPVCDGDADKILGVLHLNKLLFRLESGDITDNSDITSSVKSLMSAPIFIPKTTPLHTAVELMREKQQQLLFVVDSYGGIMGILTMEDALEVIVGDIWDETDDITPDLVRISENEYDLSSKLRLRELFSLLRDVVSDTESIENEYTVLGGWCSQMIGISPNIGDSFTYGRLTFTVRTLRDKMPDRLILVIQPDDPSSDPADNIIRNST